MKDEDMRSTRMRKGWLIPYMLKLDEIFFGRWEYWLKIIKENKIPDGPIPQILLKAAEEYRERSVQKNIKACLDRGLGELSSSLEVFIDWIAWGLGMGNEFPKVTAELDDFWYRTFNLGLFYKEPADHWGMVAMEAMGKSNRNGFFPTPGSMAKMMTEMTFSGISPDKLKKASVIDPCCGTGIMLLYASNHSLNLYGNDISPLLVKMAKINAFIYVPWLAYRPDDLTIFDKTEDNLNTIDLSAKYSLENDRSGGISVNQPKISKESVCELTQQKEKR